MSLRGSRQEASRRHFDRWAPTYEDDTRSKAIARFQDEAFSLLAVGAGDSLLDVGCGGGAAVRRAAATAERAAGVDASAGMIARARELAAGIGNVEFVEGEAERLPFADASFTALLCTTAFHHFPDPTQAVREFARVLAPGGRLALGDASADNPLARAFDRVLRIVQRSHVGLYRSAQLVGWLDEAGFTELETHRRWNGGYAIVMGSRTP